jgi:hypothetical protein
LFPESGTELRIILGFRFVFLEMHPNGLQFSGRGLAECPAFQVHASKNSLGRFKRWDELRSLFAIFALSAVKKFCWFVSIREIRVSFGSGSASFGFRPSFGLRVSDFGFQT